MAESNGSIKSARLETRVSTEQKELIERAAAYTGRSVSEFVGLGNGRRTCEHQSD